MKLDNYIKQIEEEFLILSNEYGIRGDAYMKVKQFLIDKVTKTRQDTLKEVREKLEEEIDGKSKGIYQILKELEGKDE